MRHTHQVIKPFDATERGRIVNAGELFTPASESRGKELERAGLIAPRAKMVPAAPQNKDAAKQRRNK